MSERVRSGYCNSSGLNGGTTTRDSCPQAAWDKVDPETVKKQYRVLGVFENGPRFRMYEWSACFRAAGAH